MIRFAFALCILATAGQASAEDQRIRAQLYDPSAVVTVVGQPGIQSTIEFAPDERIENVAIGDSAAWQVTPNRRASLLFLKPNGVAARTNMTVVTDRRTYMFDLVAPRRAARPLYALRFTYPDPVISDVSQPPPPPLSVAVQRPTALDLRFDWAGKGKTALLPRRAFDDGQALYLAWDRSATLPALLALDAQGVEGPVNYSIKGDYVVIDHIPDTLVLRSGQAMATLSRAAAAASKAQERAAR
ncbi:TrbG/VirB9 family P-type conjugative transfer protein [Rhizorhabdus phycosphaerae]|uniref:TrbG/VirB9 family P-type conjugative transfer protein n=1 Tax=Rhizorhabdus phycosphaerae TaxID=2711156 RepID=UPI0013EC4E94|nr:TrbG/VirB9 family P-type conjugative transfer protein [Rhizorhabdus phycosphaerae]